MSAAPRGPSRLLPSSLRARLTLSYATLTAALLTAVFCGLVALGLQRYIRSTMLAIDETALTTRQLLRDHWSETDAALVRLVLQQPRAAGVRIRIRVVRPPGAPPPGVPGANGQFAPAPPERSLGSVFGLRTRIIWTHRGDIFVGPEVPIENLLAIGFTALGIALPITLAISWAIGRWITAQAMLPLTTVTKELRRFADGDFVPSVLETRDHSELGELVSAFNGAAAQVVAAFSERERTEQRLRLFLGEAGHEMRTPLTVISAYLEVLERSGTPEVTVAPATLRAMRDETARLRALVERVMALARMEGSDRGRAELVDVVEIAHDAVAHVTAVQTQGQVRVRPGRADVIVLADRWELEEAIRNLVDNAVRYGDGAPVDVTIDLERDRVALRVRDRGRGIAESEREHLFRHFFRGERAAGTTGSGLGLAIVARAAERLGGEVALERAEPRRTVFRLLIPAYQPAAADGPTVSVV